MKLDEDEKDLIAYIRMYKKLPNDVKYRFEREIYDLLARIMNDTSNP